MPSEHLPHEVLMKWPRNPDEISKPDRMEQRA